MKHQSFGLFDRLPHFLEAFLLLIAKKCLGPYAKIFYSQEGEDGILARLFEGKAEGFYVDIGAHHPSRFSNTLSLSRCGWTGINIEPNPVLVDLLDKKRPKDVNVQAGVGIACREADYYMFNDPALNTFSKEVSEKFLNHEVYQLLKTQKVRILTITEILDEYLNERINVDYLNIDVEGLDFEVLKTLDLEKYRPTIISIELAMKLVDGVLDSNVHCHMKNNSYELISKTLNTLFYIDKNSLVDFGFEK